MVVHNNICVWSFNHMINHSSCSQRLPPCSSSTQCASSMPPRTTSCSCTGSQTPCKSFRAEGWPRGSGPGPCPGRGDGPSGGLSPRRWCTRTNCLCSSHKWLSPEAQPCQCVIHKAIHVQYIYQSGKEKESLCMIRGWQVWSYRVIIHSNLLA